MLHYKKEYQIQPGFDNQEWILSKARDILVESFPHITDIKSDRSEGGIHDYYSNGDYWWPNPNQADGLPYVQMDGETNPNNFNDHRILMRRMRTNVVCLACAYKMTGEEDFAEKGVRTLCEFFLDTETRMNPNLSYAQAIPGICPGRGIGIIDTIHLVDIPFSMEMLCSSVHMTKTIYQGLKRWFAQYLGWMLTSENGIDEMNTLNNHSVCFFMQASVFALFTDNERIADLCRMQYKQVLLSQMAADGSFPLELERTKPYNYSIFIVDNMVSICHVLSKEEDDLWEYETPEGLGIKKGIEYIMPYVLDKSTWPFPPDVMHFEAFLARASFFLLAGFHYGIQELIDLFERLPYDSEDEEARRNIAVYQPMLWV